MNKFEFFQNANLDHLKVEANVWLRDTDGQIDIISWDLLQHVSGLYTLSVFYCDIYKPETTAGFKFP